MIFCLSAYPTSCSLVEMYDMDYLYGKWKGSTILCTITEGLKLVKKDYLHSVYMGRTGDLNED